MVNEGILRGLKLALSKGESLKQAMMTFYNAGYKKEEIEEAAGTLQKENNETAVQKKTIEPSAQKPFKKYSKPKKQSKVPVQKISSYGESTKMQPPLKKEIPEFEKLNGLEQKQTKNIEQKHSKKKSQKISEYETQKPKGKLILILLIFFLLFSVGALMAIFLFRQEIIDFFSKIS